MAKSVTEKDVRYAVEFGGQRLVRSFDTLRKPQVQFHLQPSGQPVDKAVAVATHFNAVESNNA